jgi:hypothetical protein
VLLYDLVSTHKSAVANGQPQELEFNQSLGPNDFFLFCDQNELFIHKSLVANEDQPQEPEFNQSLGPNDFVPYGPFGEQSECLDDFDFLDVLFSEQRVDSQSEAISEEKKVYRKNAIAKWHKKRDRRVFKRKSTNKIGETKVIRERSRSSVTGRFLENSTKWIPITAVQLK